MNAITKDFTDAIETQFKALNADVRDALEKANVAQAITQQFEQKMARADGGSFETKSYGEQVADSAQILALREGGYSGRARIELKAITTAGGSGGGFIVPDRDNTPVAMAMRGTRLRDLLTVLPTTSGSIDYPKQTARTNAAAPVAEGTVKPYSNYGWTKQNVPVRTIAHLAKLTRQAADDAAQLAGEVDTELRYGLQLAEDAQILYGDGTGENLLGLNVQATSFTLPSGATTPTTVLDKIGAAILQAALTDYPPDGIVLHPTDWFNIRMLKDAAGGYLFGAPGAVVPAVLFGLPIAATQAITVNNYLVGNFKEQRLYDRMGVEVLISSENANDFELNLLTMRCEERLALVARKPTALIRGTV